MVDAGDARVLGEGSIVVVVVDEADLDLTAADCGDDGIVVRIRNRVEVVEVVQPLRGDLLAFGEPHRRDEVLERAVPARDTDLALPALVDQVEDGVGQLGGIDEVGVVHQHALATGDPDPPTVVVTGRRVDEVERRCRELGEVVVEEAHRPGALRQEDVGLDAARCDLLGDQERQIGGVAVLDLDVDAGLVFEAVDDRLDQAIAATGVQGDAVAVVAATRRCGEDDRGAGDQRGETSCGAHDRECRGNTPRCVKHA